jgi:hypothetical protein
VGLGAAAGAAPARGGGGVVGRRRGERRERGQGGRVVLGRARLRLPQERHRARRGYGVVHPERRHRQLRRRLLGQHLGVQLAPLLHQQPRLLLAAATAAAACHGEHALCTLHYTLLDCYSCPEREREREREREGEAE